MLEQIKTAYQNNNGTKTLLLVGGAILLAPTIGSLLKPVAKATIKTGVVLYQKGKEILAETGEQLGDLVAEAKAEVMAEQSQQKTLPLLDPEGQNHT
jgi:hypothetical protein